MPKFTAHILLKDNRKARWPFFAFSPFDRDGLVYAYTEVATYPTKNATAVLDDIFRTFNIDHPADYKHRSLSVGDVIHLEGRGFWSVESAGFEEVWIGDVFAALKSPYVTADTIPLGTVYDEDIYCRSCDRTKREAYYVDYKETRPSERVPFSVEPPIQVFAIRDLADHRHLLSDERGLNEDGSLQCDECGSVIVGPWIQTAAINA